MGRKHYSMLPREKIIGEVRGGRSVVSVSGDYEPSVNTIYRWLAELVSDGDGGGEETDNAALRTENERLHRNLATLKKAAA